MSTRRLMLSSHRSGEIPSEYRAVSYIENTSTAYINTEYTPSTGTDVYSQIMYTSSTIYQTFGTRRGYGLGCYGVFHNSNVNLRFDFGTSMIQMPTPSVDTLYEIDIIGGVCYWNGNSYSSGLTNPSSTYPIYLFSMNNAGNYTQGAYARCYKFQITKDGELVADYRPVQRKDDGVYGMYDVVNRAFKTSPNGVLFGGGYKYLNIRLLWPSKERRVAA